MSEPGGSAKRLPAGRHGRWACLGPVLLLHAVVLSALMVVDEPVYRLAQMGREECKRVRFFAVRYIGGDEMWEFFGSFGQWLAGLAVAALVWRLDPRHSRRVAVLVAGLVLASALTNASAKTLGRMRPDRAASKTKMLPLGSPWRTGQSVAFPSGHATFAVALATFLGLGYPRLKGFAWVMAVGCAASRIYFRKHFPSDLYAGGMVGYYTMVWVWGATARWAAARDEARGEAGDARAGGAY